MRLWLHTPLVHPFPQGNDTGVRVCVSTRMGLWSRHRTSALQSGASCRPKHRHQGDPATAALACATILLAVSGRDAAIGIGAHLRGQANELFATLVFFPEIGLRSCGSMRRACPAHSGRVRPYIPDGKEVHMFGLAAFPPVQRYSASAESGPPDAAPNCISSKPRAASCKRSLRQPVAT